MLRHPPYWPVPLALALAAAWVTLGFNSENVPYGSRGFWLLACGLAAGSSVAVAWYRTLFALRSYCVIVIAIGTIRSVAYMVNLDTNGPAAVWAIMALTTAIGYINVNRSMKAGHDEPSKV
jgi:hypothetical protein